MSDPGFSVKFQQKDLRIVLSKAERLNLPLVGATAVQQLLRAVQAHCGDEDGTHALIRVMELLGNVFITSEKKSVGNGTPAASGPGFRNNVRGGTWRMEQPEIQVLAAIFPTPCKSRCQ